MAYNLTAFINNSQTASGLISNLNQASNGFFVLGLLFIVFIILFIAFSVFDKRVTLLASSMITTLLTILAWGSGWIAFGYIFVPALLMFVALIWSAIGDR